MYSNEPFNMKNLEENEQSNSFVFLGEWRYVVNYLDLQTNSLIEKFITPSLNFSWLLVCAKILSSYCNSLKLLTSY